jgi:hypothetical protein
MGSGRERKLLVFYLVSGNTGPMKRQEWWR